MIRTFISAGVAYATLLLAGAAWADDVMQDVTSLDLMNGSSLAALALTSRTGTAVTQAQLDVSGSPSCRAQAVDGALTPNGAELKFDMQALAEGCRAAIFAAIFDATRNEKTWTLTFTQGGASHVHTFRLRREPGAATAHKESVKGTYTDGKLDGVRFEFDASHALIRCTNTRATKVVIANRRAPLPANCGGFGRAWVRVRAKGPNGGVVEWSVEKDEPSNPKGADVVCVGEKQWEELCADSVTMTTGQRYRYCVDLTDQSTKTRAPKTPALRPNTSVQVVVRHPPSTSVEIAMDGTPSIFRPASRQADAITNQGEGPSPPAAKKPACNVTTVRRFAPRAPGGRTIRITHGSGSAQTVLPIEVLVEETYWGAVRVGVSAVFGDAVDRSYIGRQVDGSSVFEVSASSRADANFELVVGFAGFLEGLFRQGRSYVSGDNWYVAPYAGLGVLAQTADDIDFFTSLHIGGEFEITPSFSIALTSVIRRVDRLPDDLRVGSPIAGAEVTTQSSLGVGVGIVINLSPDILRLAAVGGNRILGIGSEG